jgi:cell wall assembly regulator SMI1
MWRAIEVWYAEQGASHLLNPGAVESDIVAMERRLGVEFPSDYRESLRRHNGSASSGWVRGQLLSLSYMEQERSVWMNLLNDGIFDEYAQCNADNTHVQSGWWNAGWIPLDADGGGNGYFVDASPGPNLGQVRFMDHEVGPSARPCTLVEYLQGVLDNLHSGNYHYYTNTNYNFDGICDQDSINDFR